MTTLRLAAPAYSIYCDIIELENFTHKTIMGVVVHFGQIVILTVAVGIILSAITSTALRQAYRTRKGFAVNILDKLHQKLVEPLEAQSEARGRAEGISEGNDWATSKAEAEAKGLPFDEPPPNQHRKNPKAKLKPR